MSKSLSPDKIESNWETFDKLCRRLSDNNLNKLLDKVGERIVMCPASPRLDQYSAYPGGLVEHSIAVAGTLRSINDSQNLDIPVASILKVSLLHDLGKIGNDGNDLFINQDSEWHRDKLGQMYKYNEDLQKMSVSHRTLFLLQSFGVELTCDEWIAIQLAQGSHFEENRFYVGSEPSLALGLQQAKALVIHKASSQ
jgi:hypothetical protein